jgi:acyl carrier protein
MAIEDEFNIEISDEEAEKILSTSDAIAYVTQHPNAK